MRTFVRLKQVLKNIFKRNKKHLIGMYRTYWCRSGPYNHDKFWDEIVYKKPIKTDRDTITGVSELTAVYHYASVEKIIALALSELDITNPHALLDLGSGTGHWCNFFLRIFPDIQRINACDISCNSCDYIRLRFEKDERVHVYNCKAEDFPKPKEMLYNLICMIGVAFHIVSDEQLSKFLYRAHDALVNGGAIILNDMLPPISHGNQFHPSTGDYFKYVRSRHRWKALAHVANLKVSFIHNFDWIRAPLNTSRPTIPESHIVCLQK